MELEFNARKYLVYAALFLLTSACSDTEFPSYTDSSLYVFGDSLSDIGNARIATSGLLPDKNYYEGRFSNGPNYADRLASLLGTPLKPSRSFGSDYAFGGATSIEVNAQTFNYKENVEGIAKSGALYIVWSGGNDLLEILQNPATTHTVDNAVSHIETAIRTLSVMGATRILVPNQINMGKVPRVLELESSIPGISATAQALSLQFNAVLDAMLDRLSTDESISTIKFNTYTLFENVTTSPVTYGFSNVTDRCYVRSETTLELTGNETICSNPTSYLFWDSLHPSAAAHSLIANEMNNIIPI